MESRAIEARLWVLEELVDGLMIAHCMAQPDPQATAKDLQVQLGHDAKNDEHRKVAVADRLELIVGSITLKHPLLDVPDEES